MPSSPSDARLASRVIRSLLFGVTPIDTPTYLVTSHGLVGVPVLTSWVPARRAASVDPAVTMRAE